MPQPKPSTWTKPHVVYRAYDASDQLVYVGLTANWPVRLYNHQVTTYWWNREIVRTRLTLWPDRHAAIAAERRVIRDESPLRNVQHSRRRADAAASQALSRP